MPALERLQWSVDIAAPASTVYRMLVGPDTYGRWTSAFGEGLYFEGTWDAGERIRFRTPDGHGVVSEIAENRPGEFLSIRHLGYIDDDGIEDTTSDAILAWAPAYENYRNPAHRRAGHDGRLRGHARGVAGGPAQAEGAVRKQRP
jgi:hypothetical protein